MRPCAAVLGSGGGRQGLGSDEDPTSLGPGHLGNSGHTPGLTSPYRALGLWVRAERQGQEFLENREKEAIVSDPQVRGPDLWGPSRQAGPSSPLSLHPYRGRGWGRSHPPQVHTGPLGFARAGAGLATRTPKPQL